MPISLEEVIQLSLNLIMERDRALARVKELEARVKELEAQISREQGAQ